LKISVVITVFNLEHFVAEAIQSVLNQTVKAEEIIVVDDGSSDKSVEVIKSFGEKVQLLQMKQNAGVLPAFIAGIKKASGDVLAFLDGDDIWMPEKLEKVLNEFQKDNNIMMVTHMHQWINEKGEPTNVIDDTHRNCKRIVAVAKTSNEQDQLLKNSILCYKGVWLGSAFCIRRNAIDLDDYEKWVYSIEGKELSHQDQPIAAYLIYKNPDRKICLVHEPLFKYRVYSTNSSGASVDVHSAIKTIRRSMATSWRTKDIVEKKPEWKEENYIQEMKIVEFEFYMDLYQNKKVKALFKYFKLFVSSYWNNEKRIKETKRLLACSIFGPSHFLAMKTRKRFSA